MQTKCFTFALNIDITMQILKKLTRKAMQGITYNAAGYLRIMEVGQIILLHPKTNEVTVRNACSRLKKEGAGEWRCEKKYIAGTSRLQGFKITRIA